MAILKIYPQKDSRVNQEDRERLAAPLIKFGFKVHIGKEKAEGTKTSVYYVAYEEIPGGK